MTTPTERLAALDAAMLGPDRERAILLALEDEALPVRERAIRLAARYVEPAVLGAMVADGDNAVRRNAGLTALERQGPYAGPASHGDARATPDPELVMFALQSLARIGYAPAGRSILPLLQPRGPQRRPERHRGRGPAPHAGGGARPAQAGGWRAVAPARRHQRAGRDRRARGGGTAHGPGARLGAGRAGGAGAQRASRRPSRWSRCSGCCRSCTSARCAIRCCSPSRW